jgi:heme exporter protein A
VESLTCQRGGRAVVSDVSFELRAGRALALRGPNGSGKTTLLRTIAGYLPAASGTIRVTHSSEASAGSGGKPTFLSDKESTEGVFHYIGHANGIKPRLSVIENVSFWQSFYGGASDIEAAEDALDAFGLLNLASFSAGHLSQGQGRRLGLARLLAAPRPIWLLDEPQAALDAASTRLLERVIARHLASGGLAIVSTHLDLALPDAAVLELGARPVLQ